MIIRKWLSAALLIAALPACGACQSSKQNSQPAATSTQRSENTMADSDADRAEQSIERGEKERSGERRPYTPPQERPVDQPRPSGRP